MCMRRVRSLRPGGDRLAGETLRAAAAGPGRTEALFKGQYTIPARGLQGKGLFTRERKKAGGEERLLVIKIEVCYTTMGYGQKALPAFAEG